MSTDEFLDQSPTISLFTDETDNASIISDSATTISTIISASKDDTIDAETTAAVESPIDWDALTTVEARMVSEEQDFSLFVQKFDFIRQEDGEDTRTEFYSNDELKEIIPNSKSLPFNDIPGIPDISYDDSELALWSALITDYRGVVARVPKYASVMVRSGIPPALRGLAWKSMSEANSPTLESLYDSLAAEWTPFVKIIGRDLNRTFPEIQMFREKGGEGQVNLGRVLRAYSAYDMQVGYCQGLTFLTGPLLLHMNDRDAFCVLVKLMEDYELRSMFTADMAGLQLRMYQFDSLFAEEFPELHEHFTSLEVSNIYASQWFLSFFAVTCPLAMLVRIFDLTFAEGAVTTLMRVALAVLKRNKHILMAFDDEEQILQHMLSRCIWDSYGLDADLLMTDVSAITRCTHEKVKELEEEFKLGGKTSVTKTSWAPFSSLNFFKWPAAPATTTPVKETLSSSSRMSITSYDSDFSASTRQSSGYRSSASSFTSCEAPSVNKMKLQPTTETKDLRDKVASLQAEVEKLKFELANRDRLAAEKKASTVEGGASATENECCETLRMQLAVAKTGEVLARQEIEELKHALHSKALENKAVESPAPVTTTSAEPARGWLW